MTSDQPQRQPLVARSLWLAGLAVALALLAAPALWNGYPLLQYDTGGYLARWHEGYLVPSRSTVFGLYLHLGEGLHFWPMVLAQAALTVWVLTLTLRVFGLAPRWRVRLAVIAALSILTTLPFLVSLLITDIFAGLSVLALHLLVFHPRALTRPEKIALFLVIAFAAAIHTATLAVLLALVGAGLVGMIFTSRVISGRGLAAGAAALALGAAMLLAANVALSGRLAWTPGGYGIMFGRMLQDGIVARYLKDHCPDARNARAPVEQRPEALAHELKLCPYKDELPATADEFLWSYGVFNKLGRFNGLGDEMRTIALESLVAYPGQQFTTALRATLEQIVLVASGAGVHDEVYHTYGIIKRFISGEVPAMKAARQQQSADPFRFDLINRLHQPIAWLSMLGLLFVLARLFRDRSDDLALLAVTATLTILANAFVCGALSGPHDRYGARIVWLATLTVMLAGLRAVVGAPAAVRHETVMASP